MNLSPRFLVKNLIPGVVALTLLGALVTQPVWAERADKSQPMNIEADALRYDDLKQVSVFTGRVMVTKGSIVIRGARLEVRQDPEGYQFGTVTGEPGQRAFFRQKREGLQEFVEGEGETIEYNGRSDNVTFVRRAEMRRLLGSAVSDRVNGDVIFYDNQTDMFTVDGAPKKTTSGQTRTPGANSTGAPSSTLSNGLDNGRVRAMLSPRSAGVLSPGNAEPNRAPGVAPQLKPSTTLSPNPPVNSAGDKP